MYNIVGVCKMKLCVKPLLISLFALSSCVIVVTVERLAAHKFAKMIYKLYARAGLNTGLIAASAKDRESAPNIGRFDGIDMRWLSAKMFPAQNFFEQTCTEGRCFAPSVAAHSA
jgi:hypothetical protein